MKARTWKSKLGGRASPRALTKPTTFSNPPTPSAYAAPDFPIKKNSNFKFNNPPADPYSPAITNESPHAKIVNFSSRHRIREPHLKRRKDFEDRDRDQAILPLRDRIAITWNSPPSAPPASAQTTSPTLVRKSPLAGPCFQLLYVPPLHKLPTCRRRILHHQRPNPHHPRQFPTKRRNRRHRPPHVAAFAHYIVAALRVFQRCGRP